MTTRCTISAVVLLATIVPAVAAGQGFSPEQAAARMTAAKGLSVTLFAAEPQVRQPILVKVDDRGRLWTIQYLQYPNPAGLKRVKVDRWSRTVYDRVPKPPPHGPRGADRITILADTDRDGKADTQKDFVTGLNLATGLEFGYGGVYVLQVPYLLFYADKNRDDVPDGPPKVLLKGFGMEDAQSLANHLTWGPDGWLYGVNGSTTTCRIRGIEFQQGVWRYHPTRDKFELFCEGGGNTFGLTFDEVGRLFYSTNGGPFIHAVQGGYFKKSFGKHGPLHNLHAYGYFNTVAVDKVPGGPPTGGTIYLGDSFPDRFRGKFVAGNFLGHTAAWWKVSPSGSSVTAKLGGYLLDSHDSWFGATDMCLAPDGSMFVSDFHDKRTSHPDPDARWDRSNGRIYRLQASGARPTPSFDLHKLSSSQLVSLLSNRNRWFSKRARVEIARRKDRSIYPALRKLALSSESATNALQGVWALYVSGGLDEAMQKRLLRHESDHVRRWAVRLIGDDGQVAHSVGEELTRLADHGSVDVRVQLAATAKRVDSALAIDIIERLAGHEADDRRLANVTWWALEAHALKASEALLQRFARRQSWETSRGYLVDLKRKLIRRWFAEGKTKYYLAGLQLVTSAPAGKRPLEQVARGIAERRRGLHGIGQGGLFEQFAVVNGDQGARAAAKQVDPLPSELRELLHREWDLQFKRGKIHSYKDFLQLALQVGSPIIENDFIRRLRSDKTSNDECFQIVKVLEQFDGKERTALMLALLAERKSPGLRAGLIRLLSRYNSPLANKKLLEFYPRLAAADRREVRTALLSRPQTALEFLRLIDAGKVSSKEVATDELRVVRLHQDHRLDKLVIRHWGAIRKGTPEDRLATMRRFNNDLRVRSGDKERGRKLFTEHCATCHKLHGLGNQIGPDLTTANRRDRAALLANIVDPSAVIRREYTPYQILTTSGRVHVGLIAEQDAASVTLLDAKNKRIRIPRDQLDKLRPTDTSLMPDDILQKLQPQQVRDLFQYLQGS